MVYRPPRITPTTFAYSSRSSPRTSSRSPPITIFFIPGNPGLISYYHTFLSLLSSYLSLGPQSSAQLQDKRGTKSPNESADRKTTGIENLNGNGNATSTAKSNTSAGFTSITHFQIYGRNLGGFDTDNNTVVNEGSQGMSGDVSIGGESKVSVKLYGLEEQIGFVQNVLEDFMSRVPPGNVDGDSEGAFLKPRVILMGHSVGSYIAMEILRRHREKDKETNGVYVDQATGFDIIGGIMLFPTIVDIAKSASGRKLTVSSYGQFTWIRDELIHKTISQTLLYFIPQLALVAGFFARLLTLFLPDAVLRFLIGAVMRSPPPEAIETTLAFLKSRNGVKQAM